ncbi:hypothetical protein [Methylocapsa sp. S129]|uniref:hypothetical protein n=1 Tax=Methylocapsa sp. S129 TaxID=1641869 RepID=UPI00131B3798|nr:hypothetical protein [Methylocapsa sp. S129]
MNKLLTLTLAALVAALLSMPATADVVNNVDASKVVDACSTHTDCAIGLTGGGAVEACTLQGKWCAVCSKGTCTVMPLSAKISGRLGLSGSLTSSQAKSLLSVGPSNPANAALDAHANAANTLAAPTKSPPLSGGFDRPMRLGKMR